MASGNGISSTSVSFSETGEACPKLALWVGHLLTALEATSGTERHNASSSVQFTPVAFKSGPDAMGARCVVEAKAWSL